MLKIKETKQPDNPNHAAVPEYEFDREWFEKEVLNKEWFKNIIRSEIECFMNEVIGDTKKQIK
jgi:hypothetical protein